MLQHRDNGLYWLEMRKQADQRTEGQRTNYRWFERINAMIKGAIDIPFQIAFKPDRNGVVRTDGDNSSLVLPEYIPVLVGEPTSGKDITSTQKLLGCSFVDKGTFNKLNQTSVTDLGYTTKANGEPSCKNAFEFYDDVESFRKKVDSSI